MAPRYDFFLSHARFDRTTDPFKVIEQFFDALLAEIRRNAGAENVGFLDGRDIEPGEEWTHELEQALATCQAFVPVYSPNYFTSANCGKEWTVFAGRLDDYAARNGLEKRPALIQPVLFVRPSQAPIPESWRHIQYTYDKYPETYNKEGLHYLVTLNEHADDYKKLVVRFAERLMGAVDKARLADAETVPPFEEVESAFHEPGTQVVAAPTSTEGTSFVQFVFVAARRGEFGDIRKALQFYGETGGLDWQPYLPEVEEQIAIIAQTVASSEKLWYEAVPLDESLVTRLEEAKEKRKVVVVVVDSWTLMLPRYRELMKKLDGLDLFNCAVVVPWNLEDFETKRREQDLRDWLAVTFENKAAVRDPDRFLDGISSANELRKELSRTMQRARTRIKEVEGARRRTDAARRQSAARAKEGRNLPFLSANPG